MERHPHGSMVSGYGTGTNAPKSSMTDTAKFFIRIGALAPDVFSR